MQEVRDKSRRCLPCSLPHPRAWPRNSQGWWCYPHHRSMSCTWPPRTGPWIPAASTQCANQPCYKAHSVLTNCATKHTVCSPTVEQSTKCAHQLWNKAHSVLTNCSTKHTVCSLTVQQSTQCAHKLCNKAHSGLTNCATKQTVCSPAVQQSTQ